MPDKNNTQAIKESKKGENKKNKKEKTAKKIITIIIIVIIILLLFHFCALKRTASFINSRKDRMPADLQCKRIARDI